MKYVPFAERHGQPPQPANDEFLDSGTAVLWLIDKLWEDQLTPSDKGDEG